MTKLPTYMLHGYLAKMMLFTTSEFLILNSKLHCIVFSTPTESVYKRKELERFRGFVSFLCSPRDGVGWEMNHDNLLFFLLGGLTLESPRFGECTTILTVIQEQPVK